jgi:hypothetical protein
MSLGLVRGGRSHRCGTISWSIRSSGFRSAAIYTGRHCHLSSRGEGTKQSKNQKRSYMNTPPVLVFSYIDNHAINSYRPAFATTLGRTFLATCQLLPDPSLSHQLHLSPNKVKVSPRRLSRAADYLSIFTFDWMYFGRSLNFSHYQQNRDLIEELPPCQQ